LLPTTRLRAQTALRSSHFIFYSNSSDLRKVEQTLERLEDMRAAILALHGEKWTAASPIVIWLPANKAEWRKIAKSNLEQGVFIDTPSHNWIVINPAATNFLEVLSHEYMHAVLHRSLPNLPTWFEEGICEYYSTLTVVKKAEQKLLILGQAPSTHLLRVREIREIDTGKLAKEPFTVESYARAWAAVFHFWPTWKSGDAVPVRVKPGNFEKRTLPIQYDRPALTTAVLARAEITELAVEFRNSVSASLSVDPNTAKAEALFLDGLRLSDEGQALAAIPLMERACQLRPSNSSWWHALALAYKEIGKIPEARLAVDQATAVAKTIHEIDAARILRESLH